MKERRLPRSLCIASEGEIQFLKRDADGVFRYDSRSEVGSLDLVGWGELKASKARKDAYVFFEDRFWVFDAKKRSRTWEVKKLARPT